MILYGANYMLTASTQTPITEATTKAAYTRACGAERSTVNQKRRGSEGGGVREGGEGETQAFIFYRDGLSLSRCKYRQRRNR